MPWLALLLFEEQEMLLLEDEKKQASRSVKLGDLKNSSAYFKTLSLEKGDHPDDQVSVIDVPRKLLEQLIPTKNGLSPGARPPEQRGNRKRSPFSLATGCLLVACRRSSTWFHLRDDIATANFNFRVMIRFSWSARNSTPGIPQNTDSRVLLTHQPPAPVEFTGHAGHQDGVEFLRDPGNRSLQRSSSSRVRFGDGAKIREYSQWRIDDQESFVT